MIRFIVIRIAFFALVIYLIRLAAKKKYVDLVNKKIFEAEKADYDKDEWEKIKEQFKK